MQPGIQLTQTQSTRSRFCQAMRLQLAVRSRQGIVGQIKLHQLQGTTGVYGSVLAQQALCQMAQTVKLAAQCLGGQHRHFGQRMVQETRHTRIAIVATKQRQLRGRFSHAPAARVAASSQGSKPAFTNPMVATVTALED